MMGRVNYGIVICAKTMLTNKTHKHYNKNAGAHTIRTSENIN